MFRSRTIMSRRGLLRAAVLAGLTACVATGSAVGRAATSWHPDLAEARAASRGSLRPVLAVFTARWGGASAPLASPALASPEAEALVAACFEPVCLDVDTHAELARKLGVTHVPMVCVLADDDSLIASFELPTSAPEFVAAAARAAQQAAVTATGAAGGERDGLRIKVSPAAPPSGAANAFADQRPSSRGGNARGTAAAPGSIALVTAKVRQLSDFANDAAPAKQEANAIAMQYQQGEPPVARSTMEETPLLSRTPPAWPAEVPPKALAASAPVPRSQTVIEPAASPGVPQPAAHATAPWLETPPTPAGPATTQYGRIASTPTPPPSPVPGQAPPQGSAAAPAAATAAAATAPPTAAPPTTAPPTATPPTVSLQSQFIAALQKPFTSLWKPAAAEKTATAAASPVPPTMPPARPQPSGVSTAIAAYGAASASANQPAATDTYGSMPLGLEGYCPVTVAERGVWTEGRAQWGARHRGRTYLFAGPEQQQAFLADPDRYAPALSGDDPVVALESGKSTPGQRCYGVTYQARMYLFASPETRTAFATNPSRYTGRVAMAEQPSGAMATVRR